jgi:hypothetical protein
LDPGFRWDDELFRPSLEPNHRSWVRERLLLMRGKKGMHLQYAFLLPVAATATLQSDHEEHARFLQ